ncbi:MAG: uroporphyrinogen-III C-methyltransferase [Aquificae bacterium]|nr:uroporphyrinogen-III C-methyltransferase [Aquificota bacterium]
MKLLTQRVGLNKKEKPLKESIKKPKVYLVGAGPGEPELLTIKAYKLLQNADVVLYDALVDERILDLIPEGALKIFVGKRKGLHSRSQQEINELLYKYSKLYKKVVRLKGGDPFIFGRGGEELLYLAQKGVDVEVVPGVSSFYSAPSLFGIPLTLRGVASSFAVLTAHKGKGEIDFSSLKGIDTLVFLMGVSKRKEIAQRLLEIGKDPKTGVAFISNAYRSNQKLVISTLEEVATNPPEVDTPAVIVVGRVINQIYGK